MKKYLFATAIAMLVLSGQQHAGAQATNVPSTTWLTEDFFSQKVFIENNGQFDGRTGSRKEKVLFATRVGGLDLYFTTSGIVYRYDEFIPREEARGDDREEEEHETEFDMNSKYFRVTWENSNPQVHPEATEEAGFYYTYGMPGNQCIKANAFRKLVYHDLYPGIDAVYILPEEGGIKYTLTVHPGADLSQVKLAYHDAAPLAIAPNGDCIMQSSFGEFRDHAPISFYEETDEEVSVRFSREKNAIRFQVSNYDPAKTLVIDPWTTSPGFATFNKGYNVAYDFAGNVYCYGGGAPYQLIKLNSSGALLWVYNATTFTVNGGGGFYLGDFCVDPVSQSVYIGEGWQPNGARVIKLNQQGTSIGIQLLDPDFDEISRMEFNLCANQIVLGGGHAYSSTNGNAYNSACIDTNMSNGTYADVFNSGLTQRDIALLAIDTDGGQCFMASAQTFNVTNVNANIANNTMIKCPVPAMAPSVFSVSTGYGFIERTTTTYVGSGTNHEANGFNGMAVNSNYIYTYDGATIKRWNKLTGALIGAMATGGASYMSGGLAVDACDNIYVGCGANIQIYDSSLILQGTIAVPGDVYDLQVGPGNKLYACGVGFVTEIALTPALTFTASQIRPSISCSCTGIATVVPSCGDPASFRYEWSNGATTQTAGNLCAGTYTVNAWSNCSMYYTATVTIGQTPPVDAVIASQTNVSCNGGADGSVSINTNSGIAPFTYAWSPAVSTGNSAANLSAGAYTCLVADSTGCYDSLAIVITEPPLLTTLITTTNASCGMTNGSATLSANGGAGGYTYAWNPSGGNLATASALSAGTYTCVVTDANGCTQADSATITTLPGPTLNLLSATDISCFGACDGNANVNATGGSGNYTYAWSPSGGNAATATNLCPTSYTCVVTDGGGCNDTVSFALTQPTQLVVTSGPVTDPVCFSDSTGSASVTASGGTGPYNYNWAPYGGISSGTNNLVAGNYTCTVTDSKGCTQDAFFTITSPPAITTTFSTVSETCAAKNGSASVTASGGTSPFTYLWTTSPAQNSATADSLAGGTYAVTITDANGCAFSDTVLVPAIALPVAALTTVDAACNGDCNGSATVSLIGNGPFSYNWSSGGTSSAESNLCAGNYSVIYTDGNNCSDTILLQISEPPALNTSMTTTPNPVCAGQPVILALTPAGGTAPYSYNWSTGATTATVSDSPLTSTTYSVDVTDAHGCMLTTITNVAVNPLPQVSIASDLTAGCPVVCISFFSNSQSATSYSWNFGDGNVSPAANPSNCYSLPGQYDVALTVTDNNGCSNTASIAGMITVYNLPVAGFSATPQVASILEPVVQFTDQSSGTNTWSWSFGDLNSGSSLQNPVYTYNDTGHYEVVQTVTNNNGCTDTATMEIYISEDFTFYAPNGFTPNGDGTNDVWRPVGIGISDSRYELLIFDRWGKLIYETTDPQQAWDGRVNGSTEIAQQDVYVWKVKLHSYNNNMTRVYTGHVSLLK
jgi:gliding motility-associated-like protein